MSSEDQDIEYIGEFIYNYSPNKLYADAYDDMLYKYRINGKWNNKLAILDKWLWKYKNYTIGEFMELLDSE